MKNLLIKDFSSSLDCSGKKKMKCKFKKTLYCYNTNVIKIAEI